MEKLKDITIKQFETRQPNSNQDYFDKLPESNKEIYLKLYSLYSNLLYQFLIKKLDLIKFDNMLLNGRNNFYQIQKDKMDFYQYMGSSYLKYFYLRNNIYLERLTKEELSYLKDKYLSNNFDLDYDTELFISNTYSKVIFENIGKKGVNINYGPDNFSFYKANDAIIVGVRFDEYFTEVEEKIDFNERLHELELINYCLENQFEKLNLKGNVIKYNDFSVIVEDSIKNKIN